MKTDKQQKSSSVWRKYLNVRLHTKAWGAIIDLVKLKKSLTAAVLSCITGAVAGRRTLGWDRNSLQTSPDAVVCVCTPSRVMQLNDIFGRVGAMYVTAFKMRAL